MIDKKTLEDLISQGLSNGQIADHLGVGKHIVKTYKRKYGLTRKLSKSYNVSEDELKSLIEKDIKFDDIAKQLNIPKGSIYDYMRKFGIKKNKRIYDNKEWLEEQYKTKSTKRIGENYH